MPRHVRKTRRSKKATAKQIEAKRKLSIQAAMKSLTLSAGDITVKNLFSSASTPRMFRASGVHTWKDHNKKDKGYQWDDDKNDPFKQIPKTKEIL